MMAPSAVAVASKSRMIIRALSSQHILVALPNLPISQPLGTPRQSFHRSISRHQTSTSSETDTTATALNPPNSIQVPPEPSWSVNELRLTSNNEDDKISEQELATLARRCLIDIRRLSPERREKLQIHVGGIMRCASVLLDSRHLDIENNNNQDEDGGDDLSDEEVYDAPRGLKKIPIRRESDVDGEDDWSLRGSGESQAVMQSKSVLSKMIKSDGGESFFSVVTKR